MNITSLKYFYMIAKEGSISNVAKEVHLSQSALSQQIQKLEIDLSRNLLIRSNKGVALTAVGKIVYKYAENILRIHENMMLELEEAEKAGAVIKIQACHSLADYSLPCTLIKANGAYPNHNYELSGNLSTDIVANVANGICDIGFSCDPFLEASGDMTAKKVGINNIVLIAKNDNTFPDAMTAEELLNSCLITYTERNNITNAFLRNLKKLEYDQAALNCNLRVEGIEGAKMLVSRGFGIAFVPYNSVKEELYKKLFKRIAVPEFDMDLDVTMIYKKNCSGHVRDFIEWFHKNGEKSFC